MSDSSEHATDFLWFSIGTRRDKSTSSGTAVSPTGSVGHPPTPVSRNLPRPPIRQRPHSDSIAVRSRAKVGCIEEDSSDKPPPRTHNASDSEVPSTDQPFLNYAASAWKHEPDLRRRFGLPVTRAVAIMYGHAPSLAACDPIEHQVKVETPFTEITHENADSPEYGAPPGARQLPSSRETSRTRAIHSRAPFSPLLRLLRRLRLRHAKKDQQSKEGARPPKQNSKLRFPDHMSLLRRNRPAEALKQVTSILEEISPQAVINPLSKRAFSDTSGPDPRDGKKQTKSRKLVSAYTFNINKSFPNLVHFDSEGSSELDLRCGPCPSPQNTPEEKAIYRVKRSPSAETEEFLKIDVSIRGGTSYLPSEARRVHTPPPPHAGLDGKRRGFFFDYDAPQWCGKTLPAQQAVRLESSQQPDCQSSSTAPTNDRQIDPLKHSSRFKTQKRDWYDAKLAELDTSDSEAKVDDEAMESCPVMGGSCNTTTGNTSSTASMLNPRRAA
ncbi:hypothetical protein DV738_g2085, partial [Chaetothyriales sp. CBS 135597]